MASDHESRKTTFKFQKTQPWRDSGQRKINPKKQTRELLPSKWDKRGKELERVWALGSTCPPRGAVNRNPSLESECWKPVLWAVHARSQQGSGKNPRGEIGSRHVKQSFLPQRTPRLTLSPWPWHWCYLSLLELERVRLSEPSYKRCSWNNWGVLNMDWILDDIMKLLWISLMW